MKLNQILTKEQEAAGLSVYDDEDLVYLTDGKKILAIWSARGVSPAKIQAEAQNTLTSLRKVKLTASNHR